MVSNSYMFEYITMKEAFHLNLFVSSTWHVKWWDALLYLRISYLRYMSALYTTGTSCLYFMYVNEWWRELMSVCRGYSELTLSQHLSVSVHLMCGICQRNPSMFTLHFRWNLVSDLVISYWNMKSFTSFATFMCTACRCKHIVYNACFQNFWIIVCAWCDEKDEHSSGICYQGILRVLRRNLLNMHDTQ